MESNNTSEQGFFTRVKNAVLRPLSESCSKQKDAFCGRKRKHPSTLQFMKRDSIVRHVTNTPMPPPQQTVAKATLLNQKFTLPASRDNLSNMRSGLMTNINNCNDEIDFEIPSAKRQKLYHISSQQSQHAELNHEFENTNLNNVPPPVNLSSFLTAKPSQALDSNSKNEPEKELIDNIDTIQDIAQLDDIIEQKQKEIEQLMQIKSQQMIKQSPMMNGGNTLQIQQLKSQPEQFNYQRGSRFQNHIRSRSVQLLKQTPIQNAFVQAPLNLNQAIYSNSNNSFDTTVSKLNEFSIPLMLPKRVQQVNTPKLKARQTINSLLEEPMSFKQHLKVASFNTFHSQQTQNGEQQKQQFYDFDGPHLNGFDKSKKMFQLNDVKRPNTEMLDAYSLPELSERDLIYINSQLLNIKQSEDTIITQLNNAVQLQRGELRKLCLRGKQIDRPIIKAYIELLRQKFRKNCEIFSEEQLELDSIEWQNFMENLCFQEVFKAERIFFICQSSTNSILYTDQDDIMVYIIEGQTLRLIKFENNTSSLFEAADNKQYYTNRMRELHRNLLDARNDNLNASSLERGIYQSPSKLFVEQVQVEVNDEPGMAELLLLYFLRFISMGLQNDYTGPNLQWIDIEEFIKNPDFNEYWRYAIAMELVRKDILLIE